MKGIRRSARPVAPPRPVGVCHLTASAGGSAEAADLMVRIVMTLDVGSLDEHVVHARGVAEVLAEVEAWLRDIARPNELPGPGS